MSEKKTSVTKQILAIFRELTQPEQQVLLKTLEIER